MIVPSVVLHSSFFFPTETDSSKFFKIRCEYFCQKQMKSALLEVCELLEQQCCLLELQYPLLTWKWHHIKHLELDNKS